MYDYEERDLPIYHSLGIKSPVDRSHLAFLGRDATNGWRDITALKKECEVIMKEEKNVLACVR